MNLRETIVDAVKNGVKNEKVAAILVGCINFLWKAVAVLLGVLKVPYDCWAKCICNIANEEKTFCTEEELSAPAKFLTYIKRIILGSATDLLIFAIFPYGFFEACKWFFNTVSYDGGAACKLFLLTLAGFYILALVVYVLRACALIVIDKFLSWAGKPAQYVDVNVNKAE